MKILVTGAAGFIGSHCAERLARLGHDTVGVDNFSPYYDQNLKHKNAETLEKEGIPMVRLDLRVAEEYQKLPTDFDFIFHFAAQPGIAASSSFEDYLMNNLVATKNLIDFAATCPGLKLLVNISTSSIYGLHATLTEESAPAPASAYGVTKLAAEQLVLSKAREGKLKTCSLRLFSVYGPRERPEKLYTKLIACAFFHHEFPLFEGSEEHVRSFTYVDDVVDGVVSVLDHVDKVNGEIINMGSETGHSTAEGIAIVEDILDTQVRKQIIPKRQGDQMFTNANIDKARKLLNYEPKTSLREGLTRQVAWYRNTFVD